MEGLGDLIGQAPVMDALRGQIRQIIERTSASRRPPPILLQGETGTGKNLVAGLIHRRGPRGGGPFVDVNCAAIPAGLLEAELFGFERGAFTDARRPKAGLFQSANTGTILLDEIALLSDTLQAKLLNVIEERRVRRLGTTRSEPLDISIMAATNEDLVAAVHARRFREDLYHRLAVVTLRLPALRDRREDISILAEHFLVCTCQDYGLPAKHLTSGARNALCAHRWPGNVRELANVIERVALLAETSHIDSEMLDLTDSTRSQGASVPATPVPALDAQVESLERQQLLRALEETRWNVVRAAGRLGITRAMTRYRIVKYGLVPPFRRAGRLPRAASPPPPSLAHPVAFPPIPPHWEARLVVLLVVNLRSTDQARTLVDLGRDFGIVVQKVNSFGGRTEDAGASRIVAAFGVEPAEDAARRAALAALAIQNALARRRYSKSGSAIAHIAIHAEQCPVGDVGGRPQLDVDAKRRMVAVLDTLGELSVVSGVVVSPAARSLLSPRFEVEDTVDTDSRLGACLVAYRPHRFGPRDNAALFVGRELQLAALQSRWDDSRRGRGQFVAVIGEPGIGKSRLLYELRSAIGTSGMNYLEGRAESYANGIPYYAIIDLLKGYFQIDERDDPAAVGDKVTAQLFALEATARDVVPLLALLEAPVADPEWPMLDPPRRRQRTLDALTRFVLRLSHAKPTLLAVEDLHWSDAETRAFLDRLIMSAPSASLMIFVTYRPEFSHGGSNLECYTQHRLDALPTKAAETLLNALLGTDATLEPLKRTLIDRTEGNPFFLEESVRTLVETGALRGAPGAYRLDRELPAIGVSPTVQAMLAARIDRLSAGAKGLLQVAAVIGKRVMLSLLQATVESTEDDVIPHLMELQAAEFLHEGTGVPEAEYTFKHALTHEVAYNSLPVDNRRLLHARILGVLERVHRERLAEQMEVLAHHAVRGEAWEKAVIYLREAGLKAFMRSANVEAVAYFTRGLDVIRILDEGAARDRHELRLLLAVGPAIQATKGLGAPEAERVFARAQELSERLDEPSAAFQALWGQWMVSAGLGRIEPARQIGRELLSVAERANDRALELEAHHAMWATSFWLGELNAVRQHAERGMVLYDPDQHRSLAFLYGGHDPGVCCRWFAAWNFWLLGYPVRAHNACDAAIALAERVAHPPTIAIALAWACGLHYFERDAPATGRCAQRLIDLSKEQHLPAWGAAGRIFHGWALTEARTGAAAIQEIRDGLAEAQAAGTLMPIAPLYKLVLADACLRRGRADEGLRVVDETLAGMAVTGERVWHSEFHRLRGELLLARSSWNQEAAEACFCQAIEIAHAQAARAWELRAATSMALFLARHNRADEGRRMLGELYSSFAESPVDTADLRDAKRLLDEVLIQKT